MKVNVGIDIGGTKANIGVFDRAGAMLAKRKIPVNTQDGYMGIMGSAAGVVKELLLECGIEDKDVAFCGMGVPGTVSADGQCVIMAPNLGWNNAPCGKCFSELTGFKTSLVQDTRAAALGEYKLGAAQGRKAAICITLGTGIGAGIVLDGKIYNGALGNAGEIGHIIARENGRPCGCGRRGCVETYSSGRGIARTASEHARFGGRKMSSEEVFAAAGGGDEAALEIIGEAVELLGIAITSVVNVFSPDAVIFSGGMSGQRKLFVDPLISFIRGHAYSLAVGEGLLMTTALLGEDAPMIGASLLND